MDDISNDLQDDKNNTNYKINNYQQQNLSYEGKFLAISEGNNIIIWDTKTKQQYKLLKGHTSYIN